MYAQLQTTVSEVIIVIYLCCLYEFRSFPEGLGNTNIAIVAALLLIMGIIWCVLLVIIVPVLTFYQKYMSEKSRQSQVLNPNQCHTTISARDLRSSTSQPVKKISIYPNTSPARSKLQGPLKGNNYRCLTKNYRKLISSGDINTVRQITEKLLASSKPFDIKVVAMIHSGYSHQTQSYKTTNCFEDSKRELDKALKMCRQSDCVNTDLLEGRTYTFMAQNYIFAERYEDARHCIHAARAAFCFVADCTEMSGLVYQEVKILSIDADHEFEVISTDEQKRKLEELIRRAIYLAPLGNDYQAICLTAFMLIKKAMLHLGIFNLLHTRFQGRKSAEDFKPSQQDILEAKNSLIGVSQEFIQDPEVSRYKALYYFALSDYHRHAGNIIEAGENLIVAKKQVKKGNFDFPLEEIEMRRTLLSKLATNDSIQDIFDHFV